MGLVNIVAGDREATSPVNLRVPFWRVPPWLFVTWHVARAFAKLLWQACRFWWATLPVAAAGYALARWGWLPTTLGTLGLAGVLTLWWWRHPASFWPGLGWFYLAKWRRHAVYARRWQAAMVGAGLAHSFAAERYFPSVVRVRRDHHGDILTARMLPGQLPEDWARVAPRLAHTFRVLSCTTAVGTRPDLVELRLRTRDPLTVVVGPFPTPAVPDLRHLPVAVDDDGRAWGLHLDSTHLLVAGASNSGKGSVLWSIIAQLAGGIRTGLVRLWVLDPKEGMEFAAGERLFDRFVYGEPDQLAAVLEDAVKVMRARAASLRGRSRKHQPTVDEPTLVVVVDELAYLTAYLTSKSIRDRVRDALSVLLSQGRSAGVVVIAAVQDPRKDTVAFRDLFPTRICLRVTEDTHVDMVLGDGAKDRGAAAHRIPRHLPGVGYVIDELHPAPIRVRFTYPTDSYLSALVTDYSPQLGKESHHAQ